MVKVVFPGYRWDESTGVVEGDRIMVATDGSDGQPAILFSGFATQYRYNFNGGSGKNSGSDQVGFLALDHRFVLAKTTVVSGQIARGPDDYNNYGLSNQVSLPQEYTFLSGQRTIFNPALDPKKPGKPNKDAEELDVTDQSGNTVAMPIFTNPGNGDDWTVRDIVRYLLSPLINDSDTYWYLGDASDLVGIKNNPDFDQVLNHVVVDTLNVLEALSLVCRQIGYHFREAYDANGNATLEFYRPGGATGRTRTAAQPTLLHQLHAPAPATPGVAIADDNIKEAVSRGLKMLWSMDLIHDIAAVINNPIGLGSPHRFEFTAELVPAWLDSDLVPDTTESNANLFFTNAQLAELTDKNAKAYYKNYHTSGSDFKRQVGRRWVLNESGRFSNETTYDRGGPFDFKTVIDPTLLADDQGKTGYAPFDRQLLPCLTYDGPDKTDSVGIVVEFSFDGGQTWQAIPASIKNLSGQCGIYINEPNLAEMVDENNSKIVDVGVDPDPDGPLNGVELNYYTSLADDSLNNRFHRVLTADEIAAEKERAKTRVRITASVQMDQRLRRQAASSQNSGSPFVHAAIYEVSDRFKLQQRQSSSKFSASSLATLDLDDTLWFDSYLAHLRSVNEDASLAGQFTLERFWLGDGSGEPDFMLGDGIEKITGRNIDLSASLSKGKVYPEIIQIIYLPEQQKMTLLTRDLRFAEGT